MIISLGEGLIDFVSQKGLEFIGFPGGSPYNTSVAIARMGIPGQYLGRVSTDLFGNQLMDHLNKNSVGTKLVIRTDESSTLSFVQKQNDGQAKYAFFANQTADKSWRKGELDQLSLPGDTRIIHFGSISLSQEPCGTVLSDFLIKRCSGYLLSFDPNIRPSLVPDKGVYIKRFEELCKVCSIVKLSDEDFEWLYPSMNLDAGVARILSYGVPLVALTEGKKGARLITKDHTVTSPLFDLPVADTIGAGDTFHGAMLSWFHLRGLFTRDEISSLSRDELTELGDFANKAAGINCSRSGANPPTRDEMESIQL
ncbi:carbohydrate kinase [Oceanispirochaeta sp.]|jgi:fructokinase|uniref:carbohydrate kinase family protein n=1 Tax=Oceanispirochaeta sp. TaxID=2035350 RepID=UPI00263946F2|nr:carbohydrate kinase [Oceanispirochaeta sp.]MDA3958161.1 carbohydrate kinase [Oceanispirochaeta sp.]